MAKFLDGTGLYDLITKIKNAFVAKADTTEITSVGIDSTPTANSSNLVTSGGVAAALENIPSTYAGSPSAGGPANKTLGIPYGEVDSDSTATNIKASVDNFPTTLVAGVCAYIRNDVVASASGWTLNINGTGAKPVYASNADASRVTTLFTAATTYLFVYNPTRVSGGCWDMYYGYNANDNTVGYMLRTNGAVPPTASKFYRYRLLFTSDDCQSLIPANTSSSTSATAAKAVNQAKINPFAPIYYYSTTTAINANSAPGAAYSWLQYSGIALGYSFNRTGAELTMTAKDPVFLKCAPQTDGSAIMDADTPIVQALPSTEDGNIYIYLGIAESATAITLYYWHPIYWYKDGAIRQWTNANEIVVDSTPTSGSTNPVSSGGVKTALDSYTKKNQIVAEFDLSSADPTVGTITSGSYSSIIQGMWNGDVPTLHIIIKNNGVVVTSTTANLITNDYTYSFNNNSYTSLLFGTTYYSDDSIKSERCVVFHDSTNDVDCIHMLPISQIDPASTSDLSNVVHKTGNETIGGVKTFNGDIHINTSNEIRFQDQTEGNEDNNLQIQYDNGDIHLYAFDGDTKPRIIGVGHPVNNYDASNKAYVDTVTRATRYEPTQETPYLAIRLGTTDQQSIFITAGADGVSSSFYVIPGDNDCVIIGDFDETDLEFSYADGVSDFGYNTALLISSNDGSSFNVFNLGSEKMDVKLTSSSGLEIGEFNGRILRWNKLTFDSTPTANSTNPVTSGGIKECVTQLEQELIDTELVYSSAINDLSQNKAAVSHTHNVTELETTVYDSDPIGGFLPNVFYNLGTVTGSVTWTLAVSSSVVDEYMIQFSTGSTAPTITWPSGISWLGGSAPTINSNKTYQVSIQNDLAVCGEF